MWMCSGRAMGKRKKKSESKDPQAESKSPQVEGKSLQLRGGVDPFLTLLFGLAVGAIVVAISVA
jgi:hypothetical protein